MRPTKYNAEILTQANDYLKNYEKYNHPFPSVVGLSSILGIAKSTLSTWKNDTDKNEFSDTLEKIKDEQHLQLINKGIKGEFNASIAKLMLYNYGYSEKRLSKDEKPEVLVVKLRTHFEKNHDYSDMSNQELQTVIDAGENNI